MQIDKQEVQCSPRELSSVVEEGKKTFSIIIIIVELIIKSDRRCRPTERTVQITTIRLRQVSIFTNEQIQR